MTYRPMQKITTGLMTPYFCLVAITAAACSVDNSARSVNENLQPPSLEKKHQSISSDAEKQPNQKITSKWLEPRVKNNSTQYTVDQTHLLVISGKSATLINTNSGNQQKHETLIRLQDENQSCMSDGFIGIKKLNQGFDIVQQNCGGWFLIEEVLSFSSNQGSGSYALSHVELKFLDKRAPESEPKIFTREVSPSIPLSKINIDNYYPK